MNYQDGYSQRALEALSKGKYATMRSNDLAHSRYDSPLRQAKQEAKKNRKPPTVNGMKGDPRYKKQKVKEPTLDPGISLMQTDFGILPVPNEAVMPETDLSSVIQQANFSLPEYTSPKKKVPSIIPTYQEQKQEQKQSKKQEKALEDFVNTLPATVNNPLLTDQVGKEQPSLMSDMKALSLEDLSNSKAKQSSKRAVKPATRYKNEPVAQTAKESDLPEVSAFPRNKYYYDKDLEEYFDSRINHPDEPDWDAETQTETPHYQNLKKHIMAKYGWSEDEFNKKWADYYATETDRLRIAEVELNKKTAEDNKALGTFGYLGEWIPSMLEGAASMVGAAADVTGLGKLIDKSGFGADDLARGHSDYEGDIRKVLPSTQSREAMRTIITDDMNPVAAGAWNIGTGLTERTAAAGIPILGTAALGTEAAARTSLKNEERGIDPYRSAWQTLGTGILNGYMNKVGFNKMGEGSVLSGGLAEGLEEVAEEVGNVALDTFLNQNKSELFTLHDYYVNQGMSDAKAWANVAKDKGIDLAQNFGSGFAFGLFMRGLGEIPSLGNKISNALANKAKDAKLEANMRAAQARADIEAEAKAQATKVPDVVANAQAQAERAQAEIERLNQQIPETPEAIAPTAEEARVEQMQAKPEVVQTLQENLEDVNQRIENLENTKTAVVENGGDATNIDKELNRLNERKAEIQQGLEKQGVEEAKAPTVEETTEPQAAGETTPVETPKENKSGIRPYVNPENDTYPKNLMPVQFEGEELENAKAEYKKNLGTIKALKDKIKVISNAPGAKRKGVVTKKVQKEIDEINKQIKDIQKQNTPLYRGIHGLETPIKEILKEYYPDDYNRIYDWKDGLFGRIGIAAKLAGEQGKELAAKARAAINNAIEGSGDYRDVDAAIDALTELDRVAREVNEKYKTDKNPNGYTYEDAFGDMPLQDGIVAIGPGVGLAATRDTRYKAAEIDTTPKITEAVEDVEAPQAEAPKVSEVEQPKVEEATLEETEGGNPKEKVSQYRNSTLWNTGVNQNMDEAEFDKRFDRKNFTYESMEEEESVDNAKSLIKDNGEEGTSNIIFNKENGSLKQYEIDAGQILADKAERAALDLEELGEDATAEWNKAIKLHNKLQSNASVQAQGLQALKKWKNNTVWGLLDYVIADTRKAIDKKKTPGYSNMVNDLADQVEDAINNGKSPEETVNSIRRVFEENRKKSPYKTTKLEQQVLSFVNDPKSKQKFASSLAEEAGRLIKKNMGVSTITTAQQKQMLDLFREACKYEEGSRAYNELIGRAMQLYDSTLPASFPSMVKSLLYDNMLFSPKTMMSRNFMGNVGEYGLEKASKPFQVGVDVLAGLVTKDRTRTFSKNAVKEGAKGFVKGVKDWGLDIAHGVNTPRSGKQTVEDIFDANRRTFKTQSENKIIKGLMNFFNGYDTGVKKGMEFGDRIIYEPKYAATKAELYDVIDKYGDSGLRRGLPKGKDYSTEDLVNMIATKEALESVLQNDTLMKEGASALKKALSKTSQEVLGFDIASITISPFVEVPANKASRFLQFTPLGVLGNAGKSIREKVQYGSVNQRRATGEAGRTAFGTLATAGMTALGSNLVSGAKSKDSEERKVQENNGYQEYAIQLPNGKQVDITDMTALPGYAKKLREGYDEGGMKGLIAAFPGAVGKSTLDSLYSGVNRLAGSSYSTNNQMGDTIPEKALNAILSSGNMLVPQVVRQTAQLTDPYKRDLGDYGTAEYNKNLIINGIPIARQMLLSPKIDTSGNIVPELGGEKGVKRVLDAYLAPYKVSDPEAMKSERVLAADAIKEATGGEVKAYPDIIDKGDMNVKGYDMDNYSHEDLAALRDEVYNRSDDLSTWVINQDWFNDLDPAYQGKILTSIDSASKALGLENLVRKGMSEEEIANSGDKLYSAGSSVKALTNILRNDDANHTQLKEFLQKDAARQAINDEYDIKMSRSEYEKHEDDPNYAEDKVAASDRNMKTETYRNVYSYAENVGVSSSDLDNAIPELQGMGINKQSGYYTYANAKSVDPNISVKEFGDTFNAIDADHNNGIKKDEFAKWLTLKNPTEAEAQKYTDMYYTNTNDKGEKRKVKKTNNEWTFYY